MCGIAGICFNSPAQPDRDLLARMASAIAHRGPDATGIWQAPGIGLAHRRLSIIDLDGGRQPLANEDGCVQVVFNGEIYNYRALREQLLHRGHRFATQSDTEVLVHLYEERGEELVQRLRGMFAFAIWDGRRKTLLLARDRVGIKPLYYYRDENKLLFGSELKAILADPEVDRSIDYAALEAYLMYGVIPGERSIFRHIHKLPPGHTLTISREDWDGRPSRYWRLQPQIDVPRSTGEWLEALDAKLRETVAAHQVADVPVGAFLSGGLDSSAMVHLQSQARSDRVQTFSIGFTEQRFNELSYARQVAERFGTEHHEEIVTADAARDLEQLTHSFDEPFADSSAIPTMHLARLARRNVKVVVSGDGGDEAFGGYARYAHDLREAKWRHRLPRWFRRSVMRGLASHWPKADRLPRPLRLKTALTNLSLDSDAAYANTVSIGRLPLRRELLSAEAQAQINGYEPERIVCESFARGGLRDPLAGMLAADIDVLLPDDFLTKVDRASMAFGLEVRPPLVDHELLELAASIPSDLKVRRGDTKWILKELFRDRLPRDVVDRPKQGFEIPVDDWLRGPLRDNFESKVFAHGAVMGEWIERSVVRRLYDQHCAKRGRHGPMLWSVLVLADWAERYLQAQPGGDTTHAPRATVGAVT